jgi:hypothetical protein
MKYVLKVTVAITLLPLLIAVSYLPTYAQNTAPVPTTFEILSPSDSSLPSLKNASYTAATNTKIFYGGDLAHSVNGGSVAFVGHTAAAGAAAVNGDKVTRGNPNESRLTLGGMRQSARNASGPKDALIVNLPGVYSLVAQVGSFDADDLGDIVTLPDYHGANGFIAINEEDSLVIRLTGFADPNNDSKVEPAAGGATYSGALFESLNYAFDLANPDNDSANGVRFGVLPSTLPPGATFNTNIFSWVPNFIQGDGATDNSLREGRFYVDANISNGSTASQTSIARDDTVSIAASVGIGVGELKDSLYVVYFTATDDGIPSLTGMDSLFIMVNDSIANPPPAITAHDIVRPEGTVQTYKASVDSSLHYSEGDSIQVTFYATDQDSIRGGGSNQAIDFEILDWSGFIKRPASSVDSLSLTVDTLKTGTTVTAFKVRLQVAYNVADTIGAGIVDTASLQVRVNDASSNADTSLIKFVIANINRPPIWDPDTISKPRDSTLTFAFDPAAVDADSVPAFTPLAVTNGSLDSILFTAFVYDPDPLINDSLGPAVSFSTTSSLGTVFNSSGLLVVNLAFEDTISFDYPISVTDSDPVDPQTNTITLVLRVAPEPDVAEVFPSSGYPGQDLTIFGSGFGLLDVGSVTTSRVVFRARNSSGVAQNLAATINSWSRDRINVTIPEGVPESPFIDSISDFIPDTIEIYSSVFASPTLYPYVVTAADTNTVFNMEIANITSTSAIIKWRTAFTGGDSLVVGTFGDSLQIFSGAGPNPDPIFTDEVGATPAVYFPVFVVKDAAGAMTSTYASVITQRGASQSTDQIHVVQLEDLAPSTTYRYFLAMDNRVFFGDSSGTLNGPYLPAKISRDFTGNDGIGGFKFETAPASNSNGEVFTVGGDVYTPTSAAFGALVSIRIVDKDNLADTTLPLTATVGSDSSWVIDLGNAITDTTGTVDRLYQHQEGDFLIVEVTADKDAGFTTFVTARAATFPQLLNEGTAGTLLSPIVNYDLRFKVGLNLIGIPVNLFSTEPQTAEALLTEISGGTPSITRYVTATAALETIIRTISAGSDPFIGADDFNLIDADGNYYSSYFVSVDGQEFVNLSGSIYGAALDPMTFPNAGQYWIARPAQISSLFYAWSAKTVLANVLNAVLISKFNEDTQELKDAFVNPDDGSLMGTDFHIDASEGYILQVSAGTQWDINAPAAVVIANASQKFDNLSGGVTPSLTLDVSDANLSGGVSNMRLSDVTSVAAKISWIGGINATKIRYGKASQGITHYVDYLSDEGLSGAGVQVLKGLDPETEYIYEIVSNGVTYDNNGKPFTFSTSKIGIGNTYTVYGRMVDENGEPLAGALVYLESKRDDVLSRMVASVSGEDGTWLVNLANLKTSDGEVYEWKKGDELRISAVYGSASTSFRTLVSGQSPQNVVRISDTDAASQDKDQVARVNLPKAFALGQNYPNPFNPSTTIAYDIPDDQASSVQVQLKVYNVRGQVIKTLVNSAKDAGHYVVQWDGRNDNGEAISSGVYFYRIKAGDFVTTRKMVLLK